MEGSSMDCEVGKLELLEPISLQDAIGASMAGQQHASTDVASSPTIELCMVHVPSRMIPTGVLQFFLADLDRITNVRILCHAGATSSYFAVLTMTDKHACQSIYKEYNGRTISSSGGSSCLLLPVKSSAVNVDVKDTPEIITVSEW